MLGFFSVYFSLTDANHYRVAVFIFTIDNNYYIRYINYDTARKKHNKGD